MQNAEDDFIALLGAGLTRRRLIQGLGAVLAPAAVARTAQANPFGQSPPASVSAPVPNSPTVLPPGIRSRFVNNINGLRMHVLEAGFDVPGRPGVVVR